MKKSGGFFFAIAAIVMALIIWGNPLGQLRDMFSLAQPPIEPPPVAVSTANLIVDESRIMAHVQAFSQPRATLAEKETARQYITEQLANYGLSVRQQRYGKFELSNDEASATDASVSDGVNLIADIQGSDPAAGSIVLGAHYDSVPNSPGADDNGSAIAAMIEAARIFSAQAETPAPRSLKLVFFDQEERQPDGTGLLGSLAFTAQANNITDVKGAIILDMIGYTCRTPGCQTYPPRLPINNLPETGEFLAVLGLRSHTDLLGAFMFSAQTTRPTILTLPIPEPMLNVFPDLLRSDHAPFWDKNIPAVFVSDTANFRNPHYHTPQDTIDTIDPAFLRGTAQHIVNAIAALTNQAS